MDTLTRKKVSFDSTLDSDIRVYNCGLTVYDRAHIGHAKTIVFFDVLRRVLKLKGFRVRYVQNFTDVDDKIIERAKKLGTTPATVAELYIREYFEDFDSINVARADSYPRATECMSEILDMIRGLVTGGRAYVVKSGVYLDVTKVKGYGKLSRVRLEDLRAGSRVEPDPYKKDPLDFALWKFSDEEPSWESPWGRGRPGWHIECSAMVHKFLGEPVDIHGGGEDLLFPHHENEIAQTESLYGSPMAHLWLHVGLLRLEGEKMSKSVGNVVSVREFLKKWGPNILRFYLVSSLYRRQLSFSEASVEKVMENWRLIESAYACLERFPRLGDPALKASIELSLKRFDESISDDMNTPASLAELVGISRMVNSQFSRERLDSDHEGSLSNTFKTMYECFGFSAPILKEEDRLRIEAVVERRNELRRKGEYLESDRLRSSLAQERVILLDYKTGTVWYKSEVPQLTADLSRTSFKQVRED
jgi:cysteinyl-tRNA synthetase